MAQLVLAAAGAAIGSAFGMPQLGFAIGSMIGGQLAASQQHSYGPRLDDLRVTGTDYGQAIPWLQGTVRTAGQVWWASPKRELSTTTSAGKGGGPQVTSFTYEVDLLIGLSDGAVAGITRIWANGKLVWTNLASATDASRIASESANLWARISLYTGSTAQLPDPTYEAAVGTSLAPAYRGRACVLIESLQLGSGGQIPNLTFEVATSLSPSATITRRTTNTASGVTFDIIGTPGVGQPCVLALQPNIRVGVMPLTGAMASAVYTFGLDGALQSTGSRTSAEVYPGKSGSTSISGMDGFNYPVGIIDGKPVRVYNQGYAIGTSGRPILVVGLLQYDDTGPYVDLTTLLPSGEYIGGHAMCSDGVHAVLFTAPTSAFAGGAVVNKWYLISYTGSVGTLLRSGTLEANVTISIFGWGNVGFRDTGCMLEDDLQHVWATGQGANSQYGGIKMWRLDADNVMRLRGTVDGNYGAAPIPAIWAEAGYAVVAQGPQICTVRRSGDSILTVPLAEVVGALCTRSGLGAAQIDTTGLASARAVRSLAVSQVGSARQTLEQLQAAHYFDLVVSDKLYFRARASASVATIPFADLGAGVNAADDQPLALAVDSDIELPAQVSVQYRNMSADQQIGSELSDRVLGGQASMLSVQLAMGLLPAEAKGIADAIVADNIAGLMTTSLSLPLGYCQLEPADVVQAQDEAGNTYRLRLTKRTDQPGLIQFDAVRDDAAVVTSAQVTDTTYTASSTVTSLATTVLLPLDIPLLRDADDTPGYYVAARGDTSNFPGAVAYTSQDGATYTVAAKISESGVLGTCTTTLGNWSGGSVMDELNTVTVTLADGQLSSVSRDTLLATADANAILIGSEVIRFATATLVSTNPNVYTLSRLLRGQRGTDWASTGHAASERAVLLRTQGLRRVAQQATDINKNRYLKGVTLGRSLATATAQIFYNTGVSSMPLAPVDVRATRAVNGDATITWKRRTRYACGFTGPNGISVPLDEPAELYDIEFHNSSAFNSLSAKMTATDVASPQYIYKYYYQFVNNNLVAPSALYLIIYQKAGTKRGYGRRVVLGLPLADGATTNPMVVAASASGYIVQNGTVSVAAVAAYTSTGYGEMQFWSASSPTGPYTVAHTGTGLAFFNMTGGRIAQNNTFVVGFSPSGEINLAHDRYQTQFMAGRLDLSTVPVNVTTTPYMVRPRAIAGDGSRFLLLGEYNHVFSSADGQIWTDLGVMSGAAFPNSIGDDDYSVLRLLKIGSRWFLIFGRSAITDPITVLFYTDDADALSGWTAATGIDVNAVSFVLDNIVFDGTYHYAVKHILTGGPSVYRSADGGASWTLEYSAPVGTGQAFALQCTGTTVADKVRLYCRGIYGDGTTHEKPVGTTTWTSFANGLVNPYRAIDYAGHLLVTDNAPVYSGGGSRIAYETGGVFTTVSGF
jgi:Putative phage tail protein